MQEFLKVQPAGGKRPLCPSYHVLLGYVTSTEQRCGVSFRLRGATSGADGLLCWLTPGAVLTSGPLNLVMCSRWAGGKSVAPLICALTVSFFFAIVRCRHAMEGGTPTQWV